MYQSVFPLLSACLELWCRSVSSNDPSHAIMADAVEKTAIGNETPATETNASVAPHEEKKEGLTVSFRDS